MNEHFDGLNMGCDPMVAHKDTLTFFVCCLWGEVLVWFNIWKTKNTNIMSVVLSWCFFLNSSVILSSQSDKPQLAGIFFKDSTAITGVIVE